MLIKPVFNETSNRPFRWALKLVEQGSTIEKYWTEMDYYIYNIEKAVATKRDVLSFYPDINSIADFRPMRKHHVGFLTTIHKDFYEDGKYTEVLNDPTNYITAQPMNYTEAHTQAEQRIGNYRMGARRHITHLGGTISDDQLDDLTTVIAADFAPIASISFPFMPPIPADYDEAERVNLLTTDSGYVSYIKGTQPDASIQYAWTAEQATGKRIFIIDAVNDELKKGVTNTGLDKDAVDIENIEEILDAAVNTATSAIETTFLPADGEYIIINVATKTILRMDAATGISLEQYDGSGATLGVLQSYVNVDASGGIVVAAGTTDITIPLDGAITIDAGSNNINITAADVDITGTLTVSGAVDINNTLNVSGITTHGG